MTLARQNLKKADLQIQSLIKASQIKNDVFVKTNEIFALEDSINEVIDMYSSQQDEKMIKVNVIYKLFDTNPNKIIHTDKTCL